MSPPSIENARRQQVVDRQNLAMLPTSTQTSRGSDDARAG